MKKYLFVLSFLLLISSSRAYAKSNTDVRRVPILVYHHIRETKPYPKSTWSYKMSVSPKVFEVHMHAIEERGYAPVSLDDAVAYLRREKDFTKKPVVITFDDNNLNAYEKGVPILKKRRFVAVFYIITNRLKNKATIDAERVKELASFGMDIQSHSLTHSIMTNLSLQKLDQEFLESKRVLEELSGKPVRHIAYPLTSQNKTVRAHAKAAGYVTATIMDPRVATEKDDFFRLPRIMMTDDSKMEKVLP